MSVSAAHSSSCATRLYPSPSIGALHKPFRFLSLSLFASLLRTVLWLFPAMLSCVLRCE